MNFLRLLDELRIPYKQSGEHHHVTRRFVGVDCPWCSPRSGAYKLGVNLESGYATCWTCGGKSLPDVLMALGKLGYREAAERLRDVGWEHRPRERGIPTGQAVKMPATSPLSPVHRKYLKRRGFDPDEIERLWGIRGIRQAGKLSWRIWIPITLGGEVVSWTTRAIGSRAKARYVTASEGEESVPSKTLLYGEDYCRHAVIVCEGPLDAWAVGPGAVATMGLVVTREQVTRMRTYPVRVVCFDSTPDAQRRAVKLAEAVRASPGETHLIRLETGEDPADANTKEVKELRRRFLG